MRERLNSFLFSGDGRIKTYESIKQVENTVLKPDRGFKP